MNTHKKLKEVLYSIIAVCVIVWAIVYVQIKSTVVQDVAPPVQSQDGGRIALTQEQATRKSQMIGSTPVTQQKLTGQQAKTKAELIKQQQALR